MTKIAIVQPRGVRRMFDYVAKRGPFVFGQSGEVKTKQPRKRVNDKRKKKGCSEEEDRGKTKK
jgi:hypothetical protein